MINKESFTCAVAFELKVKYRFVSLPYLGGHLMLKVVTGDKEHEIGLLFVKLSLCYITKSELSL